MENVGDKFHDSRHGAAALAAHLSRFRTSSIVVALAANDLPAACEISRQLGIPLQFLACHELASPGANDKTIGSITSKTVIIHSPDYSVPQDYIYHQVRMGQVCSQRENEKWNKLLPGQDLAGKTVIVVSGCVLSADSVLAGIAELRNRKAKQIIVASPVFAKDALYDLQTKVDDLAFLVVEKDAENAGRFYIDAHTTSDEELIHLVQLCNSTKITGDRNETMPSLHNLKKIAYDWRSQLRAN